MNFGHLDNNILVYAKNPVIIDGMIEYNPSKEQYNKIGEKELHLEYPSEPIEDNKHWESDGWDDSSSTDIYKKWKIVADEKIYRQFSKLNLEINLLKFGVLDKFDRFLDETYVDGSSYTLRKFYNIALVLKEDHPMYSSYYSAAKNYIGLTNEQLEDILNNSISK